MTTDRQDIAENSAAVAGCLEALDRCERLLDRIAASGDEVSCRAHAAVGPHMRHCLDHFVCLFRGLDGGAVDYDDRDRDEQVERDPTTMHGALEDARARLRVLPAGALDRTLTVRQTAAPAGRVAWTPSNVERELLFLSGHTIHHLATMLLIAGEHGIEAPSALGVAYSTEAYNDSLEVEAT